MLIAAGLAAGVSLPAHATVIGFDELGHNGPVPSNYVGLIWTNFGFENGFDVVASGYNHAVTSNNNIAYNRSGDPAYVFANPASTFDFNGADFTSAWHDDLQLTLTGLKGGVTLYNTTLTLQVSGPYHFAASWNGIDSLVFTSFGGAHHAGFDGGEGLNFAMDDMVINASGGVPEPAVWAMMIAGFGLVGAMQRRRRSVLAA